MALSTFPAGSFAGASVAAGPVPDMQAQSVSVFAQTKADVAGGASLTAVLTDAAAGEQAALATGNTGLANTYHNILVSMNPALNGGKSTYDQKATIDNLNNTAPAGADTSTPEITGPNTSDSTGLNEAGESSLTQQTDLAGTMMAISSAIQQSGHNASPQLMTALDQYKSAMGGGDAAGAKAAEATLTPLLQSEGFDTASVQTGMAMTDRDVSGWLPAQAATASKFVASTSDDTGFKGMMAAHNRTEKLANSIPQNVIGIPMINAANKEAVEGISATFAATMQQTLATMPSGSVDADLQNEVTQAKQSAGQGRLDTPQLNQLVGDMQNDRASATTLLNLQKVGGNVIYVERSMAAKQAIEASE